MVPIWGRLGHEPAVVAEMAKLEAMALTHTASGPLNAEPPVPRAETGGSVVAARFLREGVE